MRVPRAFYTLVLTSFNRKESEKGTVCGGGGEEGGIPDHRRQTLATLAWVGWEGGPNGLCEERKNDKIKTI